MHSPFFSSLIFVSSYSESVKGEKLATHFREQGRGKKHFLPIQLSEPTHCSIRYVFASVREGWKIQPAVSWGRGTGSPEVTAT